MNTMKSLSKKHSKSLFAFLFIFLFAMSLSIALCEDSGISFRMRRDFGTDLGGGKIQGRFTASGSGPEGTVKMSLLFNGEVVYSEDGSSYRYSFDTSDYPIGEFTIEIRAYSTDTEFGSRTEKLTILEPSINGWLIGIVAVILVLSLGIKYGLFKKNKMQEKKGTSIDDIKIE